MARNNTVFQDWLVSKPRAPHDHLIEVLLASRNISDSEFFKFDYNTGLHDPFLFKDMEKATIRVVQAIKNHESILIAGDYDLDGISGTALLLDFFRIIRAPALFKLPHRIHDGYGLNTKTIIDAHKNKIKVIITVDNGISCYQEIALAQSLGIDVIITDHHTIPEKVPPAFAILHPKIKAESYPDKELTGSGVAYKFACALARKILSAEEAEKFKKHALDLATLGTIADMGRMLGENRQLVHYGLQVISLRRRPGLKKLLEISGVKDIACTTETVGFRLGPRLNASGRMARADLSIELLLAENEGEAEKYALEIEGLNKSRQLVTEEIFIRAEKLIGTNTQAPVLVAQSQEFHSGVIGLVAGKLTEKYQRPVAMLEIRDDIVIGSMRSIPHINLMEALNDLKEFFIKFGGHAQAAGFSVALENRESFTKALHERFNSYLPLPPPQLQLDTHLFPTDITIENCEALEKFQPFGIGNSKPLFMMENIRVIRTDQLGSTGKHWKITCQDNSSSTFQVIAFDYVPSAFENVKDLAVRLNLNIWNNRRSPQVIVEHVRK